MSFSGRTEVSKTSNEGSIPSIPAILAKLPSYSLRYVKLQSMRDKLVVLSLAFTTVWYLISFGVPYNRLADFLGMVKLDNGHSWPLAFFLMDTLVISLTVLFIIIVFIKSLKKKQFQSLLLGVLLIYPLITVWATLQDLVFNPIAP